MEEDSMYQANCPVCKKKSIRYGKDHAGSQRWYCKECRLSFTQKIDKKNYDHSVQIRSRSTVPCLYQAISKRKSMFWELPDGDLTPDPLLISGPHRGQAGK